MSTVPEPPESDQRRIMPDELSTQIRYYLGQLRARDDHHEFEDLCLEWSRIRVARNIVPATGPVSAGGDQGRDFETFRTYLADALPNSYIAPWRDRHLVFACTLQQTSIEAKVKQDVAKIAGGKSLGTIYYFTEVNVEVSLQHKLESWCKTQHDIELEILDGYAMSINLRDRDTFWVAQRFLRLPAILGPSQELQRETVDWYTRDRERWRSTETRITYGDFVDLKTCLRRAVFNESFRHDASFWLGRLAPITLAEDENLKHLARTEYIISSFRVTGTLRDIDYLVREYLDYAIGAIAPQVLDDVVVVHSFLIIAHNQDGTSISKTEILRYQETIIEGIERALSAAVGADRLVLLETLGTALFHQKSHILIEDPASPDSYDLRYEPNRALDEEGQLRDDLPAPSIDLSKVPGIETVIRPWLEFVSLLPETSLYPTEELFQLVTWLTPALHKVVGWSEIVEGLENHARDVSGAANIADKARRRALGLYQTNQPLAAFREFRRARVNWFNDENLRESLMALQLAGLCLQKLGLPTAGRYYHLTCAWVAFVRNEPNLFDLIPVSVASAAQCDFESGAWATCISTVSAAIQMHQNFAEAPELWFSEEHLKSAVRDILTIDREVRSNLDELASSHLHALQVYEGLGDLFDRLTPQMSPTDPESWGLIGYPFGDVGQTWATCFSALGLRVRVRCAPEEVTVRTTERFISWFQIVLASLESFDLCFGPGELDILVTAIQATGSELPKLQIERRPSNSAQVWVIALAAPKNEYDAEELSDELNRQTSTAVTTILHGASFRRTAEFRDSLENAFAGGLFNDLQVAPSYDLVAGMLRFYGLETASDPTIATPQGHPAEELNFPETVGPTYSAEKAIEILTSRYENLQQTTRLTLPRLLMSPDFQETVRYLKDVGWSDWHILVGIYSVTVTYRANADSRGEDALADIRESILEPESEDALKVPASEYSIENLDRARRTSMLSLLSHWALESHAKTPDFDAIEALLAARYGYWSEDVDHDEIF